MSHNVRVFRLTVLLQIGLQSGNEFSFVSLGFQTSGLTLLPQLSKLKTTRETETVLFMQHFTNRASLTMLFIGGNVCRRGT